MNPAAEACERPDVEGDGAWAMVHARFVAQAKEQEPDVVLVGDTMLQLLMTSSLWKSWFVPLHSLNLAVAGDQTQHVLWRLRRGELDFIQPKVVVVGAGGSNDPAHSAEQVAGGVLAVLDEVQKQQAEAEVVLLLLPSLAPEGSPARARAEAVNALLSGAVKGRGRVQALPLLLPLSPAPSHHDTHDYRTLTNDGYAKVFAPLNDLLQQLVASGDETLYVPPGDDADVSEG